MPGLIIGSARSTTRGEIQGRRQKAVAGLNRDKARKRMEDEDAMFRLLEFRSCTEIWKTPMSRLCLRIGPEDV